MSLSRWIAATRALLGSLRRSGPAPAPARSNEPLAVTAAGSDASPDPARIAAFDVEQEVRAVLADVAAVRAQPVRLEIAVQPGLMLRADRSAFRQVLAELMQQASSRVPVGRILATASRLGDWVQISVVDDGIGADRKAREDALRPIERLIARQGGTLESVSWPDQGTTVLTRWPLAGPEPPSPGHPTSSERERTSTG